MKEIGLEKYQKGVKVEKYVGEKEERAYRIISTLITFLDFLLI